MRRRGDTRARRPGTGAAPRRWARRRAAVRLQYSVAWVDDVPEL